MSKAILVTGSSGQLGREVVKQLREAGRNVIGIDLLPGSQTDHSIDIRDQGLVAEICQEADSIIHTAALHGRQVAAGLARRPFIEVNITGTFNLLEGALAAGHRRFLLTTSTSVYGQAMVHPDQAVWVDEDLTPQARDVYDITKLAAEGLCKDFWEKDGLSTVVLRPSRFLPEPPNVVANHRLYRGLDVSDAARGHILALDKEALPWGIFNLSASSPFQQNELV
ncbi:MAG: NAD(P)-dependent oxidoreductase, partial [Bacteroidota bacterium]